MGDEARKRLIEDQKNHKGFEIKCNSCGHTDSIERLNLSCFSSGDCKICGPHIRSEIGCPKCHIHLVLEDDDLCYRYKKGSRSHDFEKKRQINKQHRSSMAEHLLDKQ